VRTQLCRCSGLVWPQGTLFQHQGASRFQQQVVCPNLDWNVGTSPHDTLYEHDLVSLCHTHTDHCTFVSEIQLSKGSFTSERERLSWYTNARLSRTSGDMCKVVILKVVLLVCLLTAAHGGCIIPRTVSHEHEPSNALAAFSISNESLVSSPSPSGWCYQRLTGPVCPEGW